MNPRLRPRRRLWFHRFGVLGSLFLLVGIYACGAAGTESFLNFESAPIHPVALNPDRSTLAICNLPDGRIELFSVDTGIPIPFASVPVGLDPVSLRFRRTNEIWVVNHISDSISVVDPFGHRVEATIQTADAPEDVVFAGRPLRAFVSCSSANIIQVINPITHTEIARIPIGGERPKARPSARTEPGCW
jgi:YVTN family beta-propeller protein